MGAIALNIYSHHYHISPVISLDHLLPYLWIYIWQGFPSASMLYFVMACPESLGPLQCLRIWIDNSEKSGDVSWYLARIDVTDIQTGHT